MAQVDLLGIGDPSVIAELVRLAQTELDAEFLPQATVDQGIARREPPPPMAWRRGLDRDKAWALLAAEPTDEDGSRYRACDYAVVYRQPTTEEAVTAARSTGRKVDYVVHRVVPSRQYAQFLDHDIAAQALALGDQWTQFLRAFTDQD